MSKHHPTGLFHIKAGNWAKEFVKTCRALGMTDAEILAALDQVVAEQKPSVDPESNTEARQQASE